MNNLDIANLSDDGFLDAYKKIKAENQLKNPINSSSLSLDSQLERFKASFFTEEETRALHEDALSV
ncbi:MAG: hypothetical protein FWC06_08225 [Treponema sp.]|nr:hypothetical protein [Treponema sp.]